MISTSIFVYLLFKWDLLGDMLINAYYFAMSVYGWYVWSRKVDATHFTPISKVRLNEYLRMSLLFFGSILFVFIVYYLSNKWNNWVAYTDTLTTAIFFVGMWLMALRKIENWLWWIVGDIISVPMYFYKGLIFTSFQYLVFLLIAIAGYYSWKRIMKKQSQNINE